MRMTIPILQDATHAWSAGVQPACAAAGETRRLDTCAPFCRPAAALLFALFAGCASPPDKSEVAEEYATPAAWTTAAPTNGVLTNWWHTLGSTGLVAVVEEALAANPDLRAAVARVDAAVAQARVAGADLYPQGGFNFDATRQQQVFVGLPIPGATGPLVNRFTSYGANFNLSWELDLWGRVRAGQSAALAEVQSSEADLAGARSSIAASTARAWAAVVEAQRQLQLAESTAENFSTLATQVRARYERGIRSPLDLRLALANESAAKANLAGRRSQLQAATRQLEILLGRYPAATIRETDGLTTIPGEIPAGLPSELLDRRPDLVAAERRLAATTKRVWEAKAALFPRIALTASGGRTSNELEDLLDNNFSVWSVAGNFAQPIFQGGKLRANVKLAQARSREAVENYVATVQRAFSEVETLLADESLLVRREGELAEASAQSVAALRLAEDRYQSGLEEFITLLESQRRAFEAESSLITVRRARLDNRINLHLALGGGYTAEDSVRAARQPAFP